MAVARFFGANYDIRDITAFAALLRQAAGDDPNPMFDQLKTEAVIRLALGEPDVDTQGITPGQKFGIRGNVLAGVVGKQTARVPSRFLHQGRPGHDHEGFFVLSR